MKILVVHNFHRQGSASGDDQVFKNETELLEKNGNNVIKYSIQNDTFDHAGVIGKLAAAAGMLWSFKHYKNIRKIIRKETPDVVHIHTFFPLLSPSVLYAAKKSRIKVVVTLHDTRFICPCATSLRGMKLCNKCGDGHYFRMCKYRCFKNSFIKSLIVAVIFKYHRMRKSFYRQIDCYICLNEEQIRLLKNIGFEEKKLVKKYNFAEEPKVGDIINTPIQKLPERYVVYFGRIGEEKGIYHLEKIWDNLPEIPLVVMGTGPLENSFIKWAENKKQVFFFGYTQHDQCMAIVKQSEFVVFPSICYEGCSLVEIEAESLGKAVIATDLGYSSEAIENGYNGYKIPLGSEVEFINVIRNLWADHAQAKQMGRNARKDYEDKYMPTDNYRQLIEIYTTK